MINANNNNSNNNHSAVNTLLFIISHGEGSLNHLWASFNSFSSSTADNSNSNNARKQLAWLFSAFIWCSLLDVSLGGSVTAANCNCCHCRWTLKANFMLGIVFLQISAVCLLTIHLLHHVWSHLSYIPALV